MMVVIVSITSTVSMILALFGIYVLAAQGLAPSYGFYSTGFKAFKDMMTVKEFSTEFVSNLLLTFLFTIIGVVYQIVKLSKSIKRQGTIN